MYPPFLRELDAPVYLLDSKRQVFVVDDSQVDYQAINREREVMRVLRRFEWESGMMSDQEFWALEGGAPQAAAYDYPSNSLYLEIINVTNEVASIIVHGTEPGESYAILSKENLTNANWAGEQVIVGAEGQDWTPTTVPVLNRTNELFFWAVSLKDSDGDLISDFWELEHGLNPNDPADASADPDNDGYTNLDEFLLGQDPHAVDPPRPTITLSVSDANAAEPIDPGEFTLTRSGITTRALTVYYTLSGRARPGADYVALNGQAVFGVGQSTAVVTVQPLDDQSFEGAEDLTLQVLPGIHYQNGTNEVATISIADNEPQPVRVWATPEEITEGSGTNGTFSFLREGDLRLPLTVYLTLTGTATNGVAYQTLPLAVTFATYEFETNLTVVPINNTNYSGTRIALLTVQPNSSYVALTNVSSASLTIFDDEVPSVQVFADDADAREGSPVRDGRFKFLRNSSVSEPLEVTFNIHGSALPGADYDPLPSAVTIPAGTNAVFFTVHPVDDGTSEYRETVSAVLRGAQTYKIGASNSATVFIDDNEPTTYSWELTKATAVAEAANTYLAPAELVIRRTGSTLTDFKFKFQVNPPYNTFSNGIDYSWSGDVEVYRPPFLPLESAEVRAVFAGRRSDARINVNRITEPLTPYVYPPAIFLSLPTLFGTNYQTVYLYGKDRLISVSFVTNQVTEGSSVMLRFSRPTPLGTDIPYPALTVPFTLTGSAGLESDYTLVPPTNISVTLAYNSSATNLPLQAISDGLGEGWESVFVRLDPIITDYSPDTRSGQNWMAALNIHDASVSGPPPPLDCDEDGMSDDFERGIGRNPFVFDDPYTDRDGDGMPDMEESLTGTNPNSRDSDNDGLDDYTEWTHGSNPTNASQNTLLPSDNYAPVRLAVASCYQCHQTTLNAGQHNLTSARPVRGQYAGDTRREQVFQFLKGTSYPITIGGPVTGDTHGSYTAEILPPTNGVPPEFFIQDPDEILGVARPVSNLTGNATLIVPKVQLTWTNKGDNLPLDDNTNAVNNLVQGKRIFVGAKTPSENLPRNTVLLYIKTTPPLAGSNVWLRSFDVDDTTDGHFDNERIIDTNGVAGGDNYYEFLPPYGYGGLFVTNDSPSLAITLDANGEALVEMRVGMQPGDNYRVAATVFPSSQLGNLQSGDATASGYASAYTDVVRSGFNGTLSPLLSVWRKLHLEIDSMMAVPTNGAQANFVAEKIAATKPNQPNAGQTTVYFGFKQQPWQANQFENGTLTILGAATNYGIVGNAAGYYLLGFQNYVIVSGLVPTNFGNANCQLRDDDDQFLSQLGLLPTGQNSPLPRDQLGYETVEGIRRCYTPAFIEITNANGIPGLNTRKQMPFKLQAGLNPYLDGDGGIFSNAKDVFDSQLFWANTLVFGYQAEDSADGDPSTERPEEGISAKRESIYTGGVSIVYVETIRDAVDTVLRGDSTVQNKQTEYFRRLYGIAAHENGHLPGDQSAETDHAEKGLMHEDGLSLSDKPELDVEPVTIKRFRNAQRWAE